VVEGTDGGDGVVVDMCHQARPEVERGIRGRVSAFVELGWEHVAVHLHSMFRPLTPPFTGAGRVKRRTYNNSRREAGARETRRSIVASARELFVDLGYPATTFSAVADGAGVS